MKIFEHYSPYIIRYEVVTRSYGNLKGNMSHMSNVFGNEYKLQKDVHIELSIMTDSVNRYMNNCSIISSKLCQTN